MSEQDYLISKLSIRRKKGAKKRSAVDWQMEAENNAIEVRRQRMRADSAMRVLNRQKTTPFLSTLAGRATVGGAALAGGAATVGGISLYNRSRRKAAQMGLTDEPAMVGKALPLKRLVSNSRRPNGRFGYNLQVKKAMLPGVPKPRISAGFKTQKTGLAMPKPKPPAVPKAGRLAPTGGRVGGTPSPMAPRIPKPALPKVR